jgi:hypothetical protein
MPEIVMTEANSGGSGWLSNPFGRGAAYLAMLITSPVIIVYTYLGKFDQGLGVWACAGIIVGTVRIRWDSRRHPWFWVAIFFATILQIPFVMFVPWTRKYSSMITLLPYAIIDYVVINWCIDRAEKIVNRKQSEFPRRNGR